MSPWKNFRGVHSKYFRVTKLFSVKILFFQSLTAQLTLLSKLFVGFNFFDLPGNFQGPSQKNLEGDTQIIFKLQNFFLLRYVFSKFDRTGDPVRQIIFKLLFF